MAGGPVTTQTAAIWLQIPMSRRTAEFSAKDNQVGAKRAGLDEWAHAKDQYTCTLRKACWIRNNTQWRQALHGQ